METKVKNNQQNRPIRVFGVCPDNSNCGVWFHRAHLPLKELEKQGLIEFHEYGYDEGQSHIPNPTPEQLAEYKDKADILYFQRNDTPQYISLVCGAAKCFGIPAVVDYDDNIHSVRPCNPGYLSFAPGADAKMWNLRCLEEVKGLTVSTPNLYNFYKKYTKNIYLCENSIDFEARDKVLDTPPDIPKQENEIRIGWAGSAAHWENLSFIKNALYNILEKYPQTTFYFTGLFGGLFDNSKFKDRVHPVKFADLKDWPRTLKAMGLDIAIAPLTDNDFNRAKSNLRCLEYHAAKYAVIASNVEPYRNYIIDGQTGFLCAEAKEWEQKLSSLIESAALRKDFSETGYNFCKKEYNVINKSQMWLKAFKDIIKKYRRG